jgi:ABC-type sugar transport system permease subunit
MVTRVQAPADIEAVQPARRVSRRVQGYKDYRLALFLTPSLVLIGLFCVWPLVWMIAISFTSWNGYQTIQFSGFTTWTSLWTDGAFHAALQHTLIWTTLSGTIPVALGFAIAIAFNRAIGSVRAAAQAVIIVPLLLPPVVAAVTWQILYNPNFGPINQTLATLGLPQPNWLGGVHLAFWSLFAVALWSCLGFSVLVFTAALRSIDQAYFDLARVEGANFLHELRLILVPASRRTAALAMVVSVVITSATYDLLSILTNGGPGNSTLMLPLDIYDRAFTGGSTAQAAGEACVQVLLGLLVAGVAYLVASGQEGMAGEAQYGQFRPSRTATISSLVVIAAIVLPLVWDMMAALTSGRAAVLAPVTLPWPPNFHSFVTVWQAGIGSGLGQSALIATTVVAITLVVALPAAFALAIGRSWQGLRVVILGLLVITLLQLGEAYLIPVFYLLQQMNLGNTLTGLVLVEVSRELPFAILLLWISMRGLPSDLIGAAELETGRGFRLLRYIILPLAAPVAVAAGLWIFVTSWSEYTLPTVLLSNSSIQTAPMALRTFAGTHDTFYNLLAAGTLLLIIPVVAALATAYGPAARGLSAAGRALSL